MRYVRKTKWSALGQAKRNWHTWFAWFPVYVGFHTWAWLETVDRRCYTDGNKVLAKYREAGSF